jgi:hypothetical protein
MARLAPAGHFAAAEEPGVIVQDLRDACRPLR